MLKTETKRFFGILGISIAAMLPFAAVSAQTAAEHAVARPVQIQKQGVLAKERAPGAPEQIGSFCGTPLLPQLEGNFTVAKAAPLAVSAITDTLGQIVAFNAWDLSKQQFHTVRARLERIGKHGRVYADTSIATSESALDQLSGEFDSTIYPIDTEYFGQEPLPGIDGDSLVTILLYDIRDQSYYDSTQTSFVAGYFLRDNQKKRSEFGRSNEREMVYVDSRAFVRSPKFTLATLSHEFQHLIQFNQDPNEATWVNEGLSELAIVVCKYPRRSPTYFASDPDIPLTTFNNDLADYDKVYLFFHYLNEHFGGIQVIRAISAESRNGSAGIEVGLQSVDATLTFESTFADWAVANYADYAVGDNDRFGYKSINLPKFALTGAFTALPVSGQQETVNHYAADFIEFNGGSNLTINIDGVDNSSTFRARVVKYPGSGGAPTVEDIPLNAANDGVYNIPDFGQAVKRATLVVIHAGISPGTAPYTYSAEGSGANVEPVELAYDDGTPFGFFRLTTGDTALVTFDAQPGMALDSLRFKFFSSGAAEFHVWRPKSNGLPGKDLVNPVSQNVTQVANSDNNFSPWETIDLTGTFVDISKSFAAGIVMGSDAPNPELIVDSTNVDPPRSFVFVDGGSGRRWYLAGGDFLLRAYISPLINDFTTPEITLGVLQNPVFTENLDVYIYSPKDLNPGAVSGLLMQTSEEKTLEFATVAAKNTLFSAPGVKLTKSGEITIIGMGTHTRGNIVGADTVRFSTQRLSKTARVTMRSADQKLTLSVPAGTVAKPIWMTILPAEHARLQPAETSPNDALPGYDRVSPAKVIGPLNVTLQKAVEMRWQYDAGDAKFAFIARREEGGWQLLDTRYDSDNGILRSEIGKTGEYAVFVSREGEENTPFGLPETFALQQNYPNPFNPETSIAFDLPEARSITLRIYNVLGQVIRTLADGEFEAGSHRLIWNGRDDFGRQVATGIYLYRLETAGFTQIKKMTLVR